MPSWLAKHQHNRTGLRYPQGANHWQRGFLLTQAKASLKHGEFTPWVEKELGCHPEHATKLLAIANLPNPDELKSVVTTDLKSIFLVSMNSQQQGAR